MAVDHQLEEIRMLAKQVREDRRQVEADKECILNALEVSGKGVDSLAQTYMNLVSRLIVVEEAAGVIENEEPEPTKQRPTLRLVQ